MSDDALLRLDGVHTHIGAYHILHGVDLVVPKGQLTMLLGRNGAGKTTTLRAISGLVHPMEGRIVYHGVDLERMSPSARARDGIAHVPEGRRIFPALTVADNLKMGAFLPAARSAYAESLQRVYTLFPVLAERRRQRAGSLSGGEQQMLAVGRALMSRPRLVLLDEPSMGLAPVMVLRLFDLIRRVREEGYTILVVEQNVRQVLKIVDRAYLLEAGRMKMEGRASELAEQDFVRKAYVGL